MPSVSAFDVASYILQKKGQMTTWKLQKLLYYSQAWSLVWDDEPLFIEKIEAWANGPVVREIYEYHKSQFKISKIKGHPENLVPKQKKTIDSILKFYGEKASQWLSDLTHMEEPWKEARGNLAPGERGCQEISHSSLADYYGSL